MLPFEVVEAFAHPRIERRIVEHWSRGRTFSKLSGKLHMVSPLTTVKQHVEGDPIDAHWRKLAGAASLTTIDLSPLREDEALSLADEFFESDMLKAVVCWDGLVGSRARAREAASRTVERSASE